MKRILVSIILMVGIFVNLSALSSDTLRVNTAITELGIGYPHSFEGRTTYFDMFFNLGFQQKIGDRLFIGLLVAPQYRQNVTADLAISSKFRIGYHASGADNFSFDLGYSLYSRRYKSLPGLALGFNYDRTNSYGFHLKYEEYNVDMPSYDRTLIAGIHFSDKNTFKKGLPIIGAGLTAIGVFLYIFSMSI